MAFPEKLHKCYDRLPGSLGWRFARGLSHLPRTIGRTLRWPLIRIAFHSDGRPRGWLRPLMHHPATQRSSPKTVDLSRLADSIPAENRPGEILDALEKPDSILDPQKKTILVVSHDATRSGAPILALNLTQQLSPRYNVISLLLGGGELTNDFRLASALLYVADQTNLSDRQLDNAIEDITTRYPFTFAIANTVASRRALRALKEGGVP